MNVYQCDDCGFRYDPAKFEGLDLDDQPDWECPDCQAERDHFHIVVPPDDDLSEAERDDEDDAQADADDDSASISAYTRSIYREKSDPTVVSLKRQAEPQVLADLCARYELEMNPDSVPGLIQRFELQFPGMSIYADPRAGDAARACDASGSPARPV